MSLISNLKDKVAQYIDVYVRLIKINFIGRTANLLGYFMFAIISLFLVFCIVLFVGFGLSEVFQGMGVSKMAGFFLTVAFYVLLLIILILSRKPISRFFASGVINVLTEGDDEDENKEKEEE